MALNSTDFYRVVDSYCAQDYFNHGIRPCQAYIKCSQTLNDVLLVVFSSGGREMVSGTLLFGSKELAQAYIDNQRNIALAPLRRDLLRIQSQIDALEQQYAAIPALPI